MPGEGTKKERQKQTTLQRCKKWYDDYIWLEKKKPVSVTCQQARLLLMIVVALVKAERVAVIFPSINEFHYFTTTMGLVVCCLRRQFIIIFYLEFYKHRNMLNTNKTKNNNKTTQPKT